MGTRVKLWGLSACGSCKVPSLVSSPICNTGGELGGLQLELGEAKSSASWWETLRR